MQASHVHMFIHRLGISQTLYEVCITPRPESRAHNQHSLMSQEGLERGRTIKRRGSHERQPTVFGLTTLTLLLRQRDLFLVSDENAAFVVGRKPRVPRNGPVKHQKARWLFLLIELVQS